MRWKLPLNEWPACFVKPGAIERKIGSYQRALEVSEFSTYYNVVNDVDVAIFSKANAGSAKRHGS